MDISTSMPSATSRHTYCYTPSPMGVNPFVDETTFYAFPQVLFSFVYSGDRLFSIVFLPDLCSALSSNSSTLRVHTFVATPNWFLTSETVEDNT